MTLHEDILVLLINLDDCRDRLESSARYLAAEGLTFTRLSAVDGRRQTPHSFGEYDEGLTHSRMARSMSAGEIACFLSHRQALETFLGSDRPYLLLFEDDLLLPAGFSNLLGATVDFLKTYRRNWDVINLSRGVKRLWTPIAPIGSSMGTHLLNASHYFPMTATGMLWSRPGAEAFLSRALPVHAPIDFFIRDLCHARSSGLAFDRAPVLVTTAPSVTDDAGRRKELARALDPLRYFLYRQRQAWAEYRTALGNRAVFRSSGSGI